MTEITKTEVGHCKQDSMGEYIGRGTAQRDMLDVNPGTRGWLGNPFTTEDYSREESIRRFRTVFEWRVQADREFRAAIAALAGQTLGCWCRTVADDGPACHGDVIAEWADRLGNSDRT